MKEIDELFSEIDRGREGKNQGFSMGLEKLESVIDGVCPSVYTLIFSGTGNGKSSLALYSYVYRPMIEHLEDGNYKCTYFSLEMSKQVVLSRLLCLHIFDTYGIELSPKEIFSRRKNFILCDEYYNLIKECIPWLEKVLKVLTIYDKTCNSSYLYNKLIAELRTTGTLEISGSGDEAEINYTPNNPELVHVVVIDHIGLLKAKASELKNEIDAVSRILVMLRNACKISPVVIMQINRASGDIERRKQGLNNLNLNDIKDSGNPAQDCEVAISIFNPFREKLASYGGYDIKQLEDNFRVITVQKSRDGSSNVEVGVNFFGRFGYWKELLRSNEINDYSKYTNPDYILKGELDKEIGSTSFSNFKFKM